MIPEHAPPVSVRKEWLNRNVIGMTITSFLSDACHEMVTAVLPGFLSTVGIAATALGWIEGIADAVSSFIKLGAGWFSDRLGHRKSIVALGYLLTGTSLSIFALAGSWPLILAGRTVSWFGRGIRGPIRDAMLAESVAPQDRGKAFGLHRAGDTAGAIVGPLIGIALLSVLPAPDISAPFRAIFLISLIPGLASVAAFVLLVRERRRRPSPSLKLWSTLRSLPADYRRFLTGVGLFGMGDFAPTLLILAAAQLLTPKYGAVRAAQAAAFLYVLRNVVYALVSYPVGHMADRLAKQKLLAAGYAVGAVTAFGVSLLFLLDVASWLPLAAVFGLAGIYIAAEDALEGAIPAELVAEQVRGTAYGLMGTVNGIGDLVASAMVGSLWILASPIAAFSAAGVLMALGSVLTFRNARMGAEEGSSPS